MRRSTRSNARISRPALPDPAKSLRSRPGGRRAASSRSRLTPSVRLSSMRFSASRPSAPLHDNAAMSYERVREFSDPAEPASMRRDVIGEISRHADAMAATAMPVNSSIIQLLNRSCTTARRAISTRREMLRLAGWAHMSVAPGRHRICREVLWPSAFFSNRIAATSAAGACACRCRSLQAPGYDGSGDGRRLAPRAGFEPATIQLTVECSTAELPRNRRSANVRKRQSDKAFSACIGGNRASAPDRREG